MTIPGQILFIVYGVFMAILVITALLQLYHSLNFGQRIFRTVLTAGIFVGGVVFIVWTAVAGLSSTSWSKPFDIRLPAVTLTP